MREDDRVSRRLSLPVVGSGSGLPPRGPIPGPVGRPDRRAMEASMEPDPLRLAAGWERRFVAAGERLEEMLDLYRKLGFEVVADPVPQEATVPGCAVCLSGRPEYRTIYTRGRPGAVRPPAGTTDR